MMDLMEGPEHFLDGAFDYDQYGVYDTYGVHTLNDSLSPGLFGDDDLLKYPLLENVSEYDYQYDYASFLTNEDNYLPPTLPHPVKVFFIVAFTVVILLSVTGNSLVILVVAKHQKMRTVTNAFLVSLAISDLLVAVVTMPIQLVWYVNSEWSLGDVMCKVTRYLQGVVIVVSILTLTGITVDRYYAICHPLRARHVHTLRRAAILICVFWAGGFVLVLPQVFVQRVELLIADVILDENKTTILDIREAYICAEYFSSHVWNVVLTFYFYIVLYLTPVSIVFGTYGCIACKLWRRKPIGETARTRREAAKRLQDKKRTVRMLVVMVTLFALSWFPFFTYHVYTLFHHHSPHDTRYLIAQAFFELSGYSNCCVNPIIYCFMNDSFQKCVRLMRGQRSLSSDDRNRKQISLTEINGLPPMLLSNHTSNSTL